MGWQAYTTQYLCTWFGWDGSFVESWPGQAGSVKAQFALKVAKCSSSGRVPLSRTQVGAADACPLLPSGNGNCGTDTVVSCLKEMERCRAKKKKGKKIQASSPFQTPASGAQNVSCGFEEICYHPTGALDTTGGGSTGHLCDCVTGRPGYGGLGLRGRSPLGVKVASVNPSNFHSIALWVSGGASEDRSSSSNSSPLSPPCLAVHSPSSSAR